MPAQRLPAPRFAPAAALSLRRATARYGRPRLYPGRSAAAPPFGAHGRLGVRPHAARVRKERLGLPAACDAAVWDPPRRNSPHRVRIVRRYNGGARLPDGAPHANQREMVPRPCRPVHYSPQSPRRGICAPQSFHMRRRPAPFCTRGPRHSHAGRPATRPYIAR